MACQWLAEADQVLALERPEIQERKDPFPVHLDDMLSGTMLTYDVGIPPRGTPADVDSARRSCTVALVVDFWFAHLVIS